jgi:MFS family permease
MAPLLLSGIGYAIYATVIWGSIPYTVPPEAVGSAFGLVTSIQNLGQTIAPYAVGVIRDNT